MRASLALAREWEAVLEAEGLGAIPDDGVRYIDGVQLTGTGILDERVAEGTPWTSSTPTTEAEHRMLDAAMARLLPGERLLLQWQSAGTPQDVIAVRLRVAQPSVCLRVATARRKAAALAWVPPLTEVQVYGACRSSGVAPADSAIVATYWRVPIYSHVAVICTMPWETVRRRLHRAMTILPPEHPVARGITILQAQPCHPTSAIEVAVKHWLASHDLDGSVGPHTPEDASVGQACLNCGHPRDEHSLHGIRCRNILCSCRKFVPA